MRLSKKRWWVFGYKTLDPKVIGVQAMYTEGVLMLVLDLWWVGVQLGLKFKAYD